MSVIVFDLDDTLYEEVTYVYSGFRAVAAYLNEKYALDLIGTERALRDVLNTQGRGRVFDTVLKREGLWSSSTVAACVSTYRGHTPDISLSEDAIKVLKRLAGHSLYIVTDGNKLVQHRKLEALGAYSIVNKCFITHRYGLHYAKPSPYCFKRIAEFEKKLPEEIVYIGDNPHKDFMGIKPLGFRTMRIRQGMFKHEDATPEGAAEVEISRLEHLLPILERWKWL